MNITITLGWWLIPALLSLSSLVWALSDYNKNKGGYIDFSGMVFIVPMLITSTSFMIYFFFMWVFK